MIGLAWLMSSHKRRVPWRVVIGGLGLQFLFAILILGNKYGKLFFDWLGDFFSAVVNTTDAGSAFLFNIYPQPGDEALPPSVHAVAKFRVRGSADHYFLLVADGHSLPRGRDATELCRCLPGLCRKPSGLQERRHFPQRRISLSVKRRPR